MNQEYLNLELTDALGKTKTVKISPEELSLLETSDSDYVWGKPLLGNDPTLQGEYLPKNKRVCRFCFKSSPNASFRKKAHILPELMNGSKKCSQFECDNCNGRISKFESALGDFLHPERAIAGQRGKRGRIKFKGKGGAEISHIHKDYLSNPNSQNSEILRDIMNSDKEIVFFKQGDSQEIVTTDNRIDISIERPPYVPFDVYRCFLHIGLSMLNQNELKAYSSIHKWLMSVLAIPEEQEGSIPFATVHKTRIPVLRNIVSSPVALIMRRKEERSSDQIPTQLILLYNSSIYQIPLLSDEDIEFMNPLYALESA